MTQIESQSVNPILSSFNESKDCDVFPPLPLPLIDQSTDRHPTRDQLKTLAKHLGQHARVVGAEGLHLEQCFVLERLALLIQSDDAAPLDEKTEIGAKLLGEAADIAARAGEYSIAANLYGNQAVALLRGTSPQPSVLSNATAAVARAKHFSKRCPSEAPPTSMLVAEAALALVESRRGKASAKKLRTAMGLLRVADQDGRIPDPAQRAVIIGRQADILMMLYDIECDKIARKEACKFFDRLPERIREGLNELGFDWTNLVTEAHDFPSGLGLDRAPDGLSIKEVEEAARAKIAGDLTELSARIEAVRREARKRQQASAYTELSLARLRWLAKPSAECIHELMRCYVREYGPSRNAAGLNLALRILHDAFELGVVAGEDFINSLVDSVQSPDSAGMIPAEDLITRRLACGIARAGFPDRALKVLPASILRDGVQELILLHDPQGVEIIHRTSDQVSGAGVACTPEDLLGPLWGASPDGVGLNLAESEDAPGLARRHAIDRLVEAQSQIIEECVILVVPGDFIMLRPYGHLQQFPLQPVLDERCSDKVAGIQTVLDPRLVGVRPPTFVDGMHGSVHVALDGTLPLASLECEAFPRRVDEALGVEMGTTLCHAPCSKNSLRTSLEQDRITVYSGHSHGNVVLGPPALTLKDQDFTLEDICSVDCSSLELAILASCESGKQPMDPTDAGLSSLAQALIKSGASAVLATYWSVLDRTAFCFVDHFLGELATVEPTVEGAREALTRTRLWMKLVTVEDLEREYRDNMTVHPNLRFSGLRSDCRPFLSIYNWGAFYLLGRSI